MYTEHVEALTTLRGQVPDQLIDVLKHLLGNCQAELTHRGPVKIDIDKQDTPDDDDRNLYAAITARSGNGTYDLSTGRVKNGAAALFEGPVIINLPDFPVLKDGDKISLIIKGGSAYMENIYASNYYNQSGGSPSVGTNALLDGTNHTDTTAQSVTRGSIVYGNSTPAWDELAVGSADQVLASDGTDVSWQSLSAIGGGFLQVSEILLKHDDYSAASTTETIDTGITVGPRTYLLDCCYRLEEQYTGGTVASALIEVGISGDPTVYNPHQEVDLTSAAVGTVTTTSFKGADGIDTNSYSSATNIHVRLTTTVDNISNLTAGEVRIWIPWIQLPEDET